MNFRKYHREPEKGREEVGPVEGPCGTGRYGELSFIKRERQERFSERKKRM
jgi:hypothetical protein